MNKVATQESKSDFFKWILITILVISGVWGNFFLSDQPWFLRAIGLIMLASVALFCVTKTQAGQSAINFFQESRTELRKVYWPSRQETVQTTYIVVAVVLIMAVLLWLLDAMLFRIMTVFTG